MKVIADQFKLPVKRVIRDGWKIRGYRIQERASFEIVFADNIVRFYLSVPESIASAVSRRAQSVWEGATVEIVLAPKSFDPTKSAAYELVYARHDLYSLHTDAKDNLPLGSVLEAGQLLGADDSARVCAYFDPIHQPTWRADIAHAWERLRAGHAPRKWDFSMRNIAQIGGSAIGALLREVVATLSDFLGDAKQNVYLKNTSDSRASRFAIEQLTQATRQKAGKHALRTYLWTVAESDDPVHADHIAKSLAMAFADLNADNELVPRKLTGRKREEALRTIETKRPPRVNLTYNIMSTAEASKIAQVPGRELQEMYPNVEAINMREFNVDQRLTKGGMLLGDVTYRGNETTVYMPTSDLDELCLPDVYIGGMGQGKTKGAGANKAVEAVRNGFSAVVVDPAKGEIGDEIQAVLRPDQVMRIRVGETPLALDWSEVNYSPLARGRLANTMVSFFNNNADEAGAQTVRYIRAAVMGMKSGKLSELVRILNDEIYRAEIIADMPPGHIHRLTLESLDKNKSNSKVLDPIYNRLEMILGDPFLERCMDADNSLDMVDLMSQRGKAIIFDVPKNDLGPEAVDMIVNLLSTKIDLAMTLRAPENQFPCFVIFDEPHQYLKSARLWKSAAVESRKWRVGYVWLFHSWEQIPRDLAEIIKAALVHYHLYPSSKKTFMDLREEIAPFTLEDALKLKRWYAINIIRSGGETVQPFIAKMAAPPSERL